MERGEVKARRGERANVEAKGDDAGEKKGLSLGSGSPWGEVEGVALEKSEWHEVSVRAVVVSSV